MISPELRFDPQAHNEALTTVYLPLERVEPALEHAAQRVLDCLGPDDPRSPFTLEYLLWLRADLDVRLEEAAFYTIVDPEGGMPFQTDVYYGSLFMAATDGMLDSHESGFRTRRPSPQSDYDPERSLRLRQGIELGAAALLQAMESLRPGPQG